MKKKILICLGAMFMLVACNTIQGAGEDIKDAGQGISNVAVKTKNKIEGQ